MSSVTYGLNPTTRAADSQYFLPRERRFSAHWWRLGACRTFGSCSRAVGRGIWLLRATSKEGLLPNLRLSCWSARRHYSYSVARDVFGVLRAFSTKVYSLFWRDS